MKSYACIIGTKYKCTYIPFYSLFNKMEINCYNGVLLNYYWCIKITIKIYVNIFQIDCLKPVQLGRIILVLN